MVKQQFTKNQYEKAKKKFQGGSLHIDTTFNDQLVGTPDCVTGIIVIHQPVDAIN
jgi:hypothetical protein